jgi:hypothetical protein
MKTPTGVASVVRLDAQSRNDAVEFINLDLCGLFSPYISFSQGKMNGSWVVFVGESCTWFHFWEELRLKALLVGVCAADL